MSQIPLGLDPMPRKTRKEVFLEEMNQVVPWAALVALIQPYARCALGVRRTPAVCHRDHAAHRLPAALVEPQRSGRL